ncbi:MAG TPA: type III-A CRISPR-associated RAMP protein Csm5 [Spirochaetales bacterium]|nr:type III-A CRISPR-associated RAMP protein Csm5 [Spirochaetales bacterium]
MEHYIIKIEPLTVLHIGTGRTVEPHEYTVYNTNNNPLYLRINYENIFERITDEKLMKKLIKELSTTNDFIRFRSILQEESGEFFTKNFIYGSHVTGEFVKEFKEKYSDPNNQLAILENYRPPFSKVPFIPGSSIKGAIRTALLNKYAKNVDRAKLPNLRKLAEYSRRNDNSFQQALLNYHSAKEDPFRTIHISDGKVTGKRQMIVGIAYNFSLKNGIPRDSTIPIYLEAIRGMAADGDASTKVTVRLQSELVATSRILNKEMFNGIPFKIDKGEIITDCNTFYKKAWEFEFENFYLNNPDTTNFGLWERLNSDIKEIGTNHNEFLLRIGRFSHMEAVTIEEFRKPPKGYGKSRTLFSYKDMLLPIGWVKATIEEPEDE